MQSSNLTPPSSASSSSSLSSSSSSSSITISSSKKYKRKSNGTFHSSFNSKIAQTSSSNTPKPFYSEYLNSKCIINVFFKGDILSAIDDHFTKSFNLKSSKSNQYLNNNNSNNSNINTSNNNNYQNDYYWSPVSTNSNNKLVASYFSNFNQTDQSNGQESIWPYYQAANQQFYDSTNYQNLTNTVSYENNSWNRPNQYPAYSFYDSNNKHKTKEIKEEPTINYDSNQIYSNQSNVTSYSNLASLDFNNRYSTHYSGFDLNNIEAQTSNHQLTNNLRDTTSYATTTPVYNY